MDAGPLECWSDSICLPSDVHVGAGPCAGLGASCLESPAQSHWLDCEVARQCTGESGVVEHGHGVGELGIGIDCRGHPRSRGDGSPAYRRRGISTGVCLAGGVGRGRIHGAAGLAWRPRGVSTLEGCGSGTPRFVGAQCELGGHFARCTDAQRNGADRVESGGHLDCGCRGRTDVCVVGPPHSRENRKCAA